MADSHNEMAKEKIANAKDYVIDAIAETMDVYGVTPAAGKLYATMYFQDQMNLDEMREELGMSKPSMSTSVRKLQEIEMVKKKFQRGSRKHTYAAEKNFFHSFMSYFCQMWDREAKMNMEAIKYAEFELDQIFEDENVSPELAEEARKIYDQLDQSKNYYRWLERLVASIRSEEIFEFLPKYPEE
ncbi:DNA-binding transcriptional regulator GbsR, MarR family [Lentibacillus halodurans]|uniref:HTH-type transcriptional regulator n=1 Tax=Lentibacillus halodurans TaxID=237679 RepID=A0A1I0ZU20_9BACI|nr:GbsR/MarR family transcriptional regulator [Lentibacillus halodurans]SFB28812.1 DNA-binding transcriptional regulator GbsR, MarR family [Lentibacillus halodurans]